MTGLDTGIVIAYLSLIFFIGIRTNRYIENFDSFMVANRNVGLALGVVTMLGTELGLITVMYNAQTGARDLFSSFHIGALAFIVTLIIGLTGFVVTRLRELNIKSIPEYYELRFNKNVRVLGAIILVLGGVLNMGLFLKIGAMFIQGVFNLNSEFHLTVIMFILLLLVLTYTISGGMISVIITDYIQFIVLSIGMLIATYYSIKAIGWSDIFLFIDMHSKGKDIYNPFISKGGYYISWQIVLGFVSAVIWPTAITRILALKSPEIVKKQYIWSSFSFLIRFIVPAFIGICAFIYMSNAKIDNDLLLMPSFLSEILPTGVLGLVVAGMLAAFMSTHDSYLLCWSSIITNDIIEPLAGRKISSEKKILFTRILIVILGIYIFYWGMFYKGTDAIWSYLGITGAIYFTGAISVVVFGIYWKGASSTGAQLALLGGLSSIFGLEQFRGSYFSAEEVGLACLIASTALMIIGSILFPDKKRESAN